MEQEFFQIETEGQAGFRAGRSTVDHIFCLRQLIEKKMAVKHQLHLLFVDCIDSIWLCATGKHVESVRTLEF